MNRRAILIVAGIVLVLLAAAASTQLFGWSGEVRQRALSPGDSVELESGIRLTVPAGWSGRYTKYAWSPSWLPLGAADLHQSEYLSLVSSSRDAVMVSFVTYYRNGRPVRTGPVVGSGANVDVFGPQESGALTTVRMQVPDHRLGFAFIDGGARDPMTAAREVWSVFGVKGAGLP
ncbi:MAG: hypothetical protein LLG08_08990 [Actinomycetia bacterium]|nr:hypothetical protein [Actinomycetes bacterium]